MPLLVIALLLFITNQAAQPAVDDPQAHARRLVTALTAREFGTIEAEFTEQMKTALPAGRLAASWTGVQGQLGALKSCAPDSRLRTVDDKRMVITTCEFERTRVDVQFAFDRDNKISGFSIRPAAAPVVPYTPPSYAASGTFTEADVIVGGPEWPLPGTLTLPNGNGPFPALVLVHGSGPNDRDETLGANKPFKDLALGLASRGIAVLRYEKRSKVFAPKMAASPSVTVKEEAIDDVAEAIAALKKQPKIDQARIFVLGHSLGGTLIPRIAAANPSIAGAIVMAGSARPIEDIIVEQTRYLALADGTISPAEQEQIDAASKARAEIKALTAQDVTAGRQVFNAPAGYWLDLKGYDPAAAAASLKTRLLVLQGERDYQVTMEDFARWKAALDGRANVTFIKYQALNHLFIAGTGKSLPAEYSVASHVYEPVIGDIADWIKR